jgi:16S rRNA (cytidine1402-2'-O)-methyltransferase
MVGEGSQPKPGKKNENQPTAQAPSGTLYVVSGPIGDPDDITIRALRILKTVSIIASENPASTQALLAHHHVAGTITSYGPRNLDDKVALLLNHLRKGHDVALVSDCGTPVIYDPGCQFIREAHRAGIPVRAVPGPSALTAAVAVSGCPGDSLVFEGHLPRPGRPLNTFLTRLRGERRTLVLFVASDSIELTLLAIEKVFPKRRITIAQDLTKPEETTLQGTARLLKKNIRCVQKGAEVAMVIEGPTTRDRSKRRSRYVPTA